MSPVPLAPRTRCSVECGVKNETVRATHVGGGSGYLFIGFQLFLLSFYGFI